MKHLVVIVITLVGGCTDRALLLPSSGGPGPGPIPVGGPLDFALPGGGPLDLSVPSDGPPQSCSPSAERQFVSVHIALPASRTDFAIDLNGDGKLDNALGNVIGALQAQALDPQSVLDQANRNGQGLFLLGEFTTDGTTSDTTCVVTRYLNALAQPNPDFSGAGQFTADPKLPSDVFGGTLVGGVFSWPTVPSVAVPSLPITLQLPLLGPGLVPLPLVGASLRYSHTKSGLTGGVLTGAVRQSDMQSTVIPALAAQLDQLVSATPCDLTCQQNEAIFDVGGCTNADGTMAQARDHRIDVCEVADNSIIKNVLAPDVQLFDASGAYRPNPQNTNKDSFSVGVGFTAVFAKF
jgi:hypothetical protein